MSGQLFMGTSSAAAPVRVGGLLFKGNLQGALHFDEPTHVYRVGIVPVPSVTQVLRDAGISTNFQQLVEDGKLSQTQLQEKREVGRAVHVATHYYDLGELKPGTIDPRVDPYLQAWISFREVTGFKPYVLETFLHHPGYLVAGMLDRAGRFERFEDLKPFDLHIVDIKTGDPEDAAADWQTAAYAELLAQNLEPDSPGGPCDPLWLRVRPRYSVQLLDTGHYKLTRYPKDPKDDAGHQQTRWRQFASFLETVRCQRGRR